MSETAYLVEYSVGAEGRQSRHKTWVTEKDDKWVQILNLGYMPKSKNDKIIKSQVFKDENDLDWKPVLIESDSDFGWLSPSGEFFGCHYHNHDIVSELVIKLPSRILEKTGWTKVSYGDWECQRRLTPEQKQWLLNRFDNIKITQDD